MKHENKSTSKNLTYQRAYQRVLEFFGYDKDKTNSFWMSKHELFENMSPYEMVKNGMGMKLIKIMNRCV